MNVYGGFITDASLNALLEMHRPEIADNVVYWLVNEAKKKNVNDLESKLETWSERIRMMVLNCRIDIVEGKAVVIADSNNTATLKGLVYGTEWFNPVPDMLDVMFGKNY